MRSLRLLVFPSVLFLVALTCLRIAVSWLRRGQFVFQHEARKQIISSATDPVTFWWSTGILFSIGVILTGVALYLAFRSRSDPETPKTKTEMPIGLRFITAMCFAFGLFLPLSLLPLEIFRINGAPVSFADFWRRGGGPIFLITGIIFPLIGFAFLKARQWSRFAFSSIWIVLAIASFILDSVTDAMGALIWAAGITYYLFWRRTVQRYFAPQNRS